jgi:flagellar M-ring protein FliF
VLLTLHPGRALDRAQIAGIVHLVSSSVPEMSPKAVSVLDQSGALLTGGAEGATGAGLDAQQLQYVNQIEAGYTKRILELVEPIVGHDNLRASVTAEIDFSQTEATSEEFKPNQGADASVSIRSQQTTEQGGAGATALASGVPGAASNQPPIAATAPLTGASQPLHAAVAGILSGNGGRREAVTNYEVDKTVRVVKSATGNVKRLNAAVVVNNRSVTDAKGRTTQVPLAADEIEKITALVRESIGFNQERGDSVKVVNAPFKVEPRASTETTSFWKSPDLIDIVRLVALPAGLAIVAVLVFFGLVRPVVKTALVARPAQLARPGTRLDAVVDDQTPYPPALAAPTVQRQIEGAKALAKDNPAAVAGIVRGWVGGNEAA